MITIIFRTDLLRSQLCSSVDALSDLSVDELQEMYDTTLSSLLNKHVPKRRRYQPLVPWFDSECSAARRRTRAFERRYRKSKLSADRLIWTVDVRRLHALYEKKRNLYWMAKVKDSQGNPKKLWKTLSSVL